MPNDDSKYFGPSQPCKDPQMRSLKALHGTQAREKSFSADVMTPGMQEPKADTTANNTVILQGRGELEES
ncbi:MAG: hypothetical protein C5B60_05365 [Chloroflexi bacterium]|nr:MAG: hypothetical protein C5B60_05365 [Chloroflexota bacterium]